VNLRIESDCFTFVLLISAFPVLMKIALLILLLAISGIQCSVSQAQTLSSYNVIWSSQSRNSSESMPCGGGDIGLNVWVEKGELLFYMAQSGVFDENNASLKVGRVRVKLSPNPFEGKTFRQELSLQDGHVKIRGANGTLTADVRVWVDVFRPVIHVDIQSSKATKVEATYETWRTKDRVSKGEANKANTWKHMFSGEVTTFRDTIRFESNAVLFYHQNRATTVFDMAVKQQGLEDSKEQLYNPMKNLIFGGTMLGPNMRPAGKTTGKYIDTDFDGWKLASVSPARSHTIAVYLHTDTLKSVAEWQTGVRQLIVDATKTEKTALPKTLDWWKQFWNRSSIFIQSDRPDTSSATWQVGRNYQLFRYMLGCNAMGKWPTKFNGGLFTYDPVFTNKNDTLSPDFRNWGGGTHTAQNQRLVYFPMLKSGDFDLMKPQFDFYLRILKTAELRTKHYWGHEGASFTEQIENFGLPNPAEYGYKRPADYDRGMEYNRWLEYLWDTSLEFCLMMLDEERYTGNDILAYIPFIESCLTFFDQHYQYLARKRGASALDEKKQLVIYPGSAAETYKMAYNPSSTVAGLTTVLTRLLDLPDTYLNDQKRKIWTEMLKRIPPISFREFNGHVTISPAKLWERINNTESPQLYPVFPWGTYGLGKPGLDTAINTYKYDPDVIKQISHIGWRQHSIFAARLGLTDEAARLTTLKLEDSGRRFPAFWGPGFDWTPDHNWGGAGMIGLQEMLMQTDGKVIRLLPAWPRNWDVTFKLHAPYSTTVEGRFVNGKVEKLTVTPAERAMDVILPDFK
jgi:hypothetical protein